MSDSTTNIAPARTSFVGRSKELERLGALLERHPLVTLLGSGGIGKTRLSRTYGASARRYEEVWFCDLVSAHSEEDFVAGVASALGIGMANSASPRQLGHALATRDNTLIILDNLEQGIETAASAVSVWLDEAPNVTFLATSREPLRVRGECCFELEPLSVEAAVELFEARAKLVRSDFELDDKTRPVVQRLVERLDALPLAIELAASRIKLLPPAKLLERLESDMDVLERRTRDVDERHRTMRAAIEWSWQMLDDAERQALAEATVFAGGFSLEAAEAVLLQKQSDAWAGDVLEALVDRSLVRLVSPPSEPARFDLFATIREFAKTRLDDHARESAEFTHAEYYIELLSELRNPSHDLEGDNIEAVFVRFVERDPQLAARAAMACYRLLRSRRVYRKIFAIVDRALEADIASAELASKLFGARAISHQKLGRYRAALADVEEGLELIDGVDAPASSVFLRVTQATILGATGTPHRARGPLERALEDAVAMGDPWLEAIVRGNLAVNDFDCGDFEKSRRSLDETIEFTREHDLEDIEAYALCNAARLACERGELSRAGRLLERARQTHPGGDRKFELEYLEELGYLHIARGEPEDARNTFRRALRDDRSIGDRHSHIDFLFGLSLLEASNSRAPGSYLREVLDIVRGTDDSVPRVHAATRLAALELADGEFAEARRRLERVVDEADALEHRAIRAIVHGWLAVACAACGDFDEARARLETCESVAAGPDGAIGAGIGCADFERLVDLIDEPDPKALGGVDAVADELDRRRDELRFDPSSRIVLWRGYEPLCDLARVFESAARYLADSNPAQTLRIAADGSAFCPPGEQEPVDLSSRSQLKRILARLAELRDEAPGDGLSVDEVLACGWPDDVVTEEAGASRVYTAVRTLRGQGLDGILITGPDGYMLDPSVAFAWL